MYTSTHIMMRINRQDIRIENLMKVFVAYLPKHPKSGRINRLEGHLSKAQRQKDDERWVIGFFSMKNHCCTMPFVSCSQLGFEIPTGQGEVGVTVRFKKVWEPSEGMDRARDTNFSCYILLYFSWKCLGPGCVFSLLCSRSPQDETWNVSILDRNDSKCSNTTYRKNQFLWQFQGLKDSQR